MQSEIIILSSRQDSGTFFLPFRYVITLQAQAYDNLQALTVVNLQLLRSLYDLDKTCNYVLNECGI